MILSCPLDRFLRGFQTCAFLDLVWRQFSVDYRIVGYLDTFTQVHLSRTCPVILVDRSEVALAATEWREGFSLTAWTVPTPPVASFPSIDLSDSEDD